MSAFQFPIKFTWRLVIDGWVKQTVAPAEGKNIIFDVNKQHKKSCWGCNNIMGGCQQRGMCGVSQKLFCNLLKEQSRTRPRCKQLNERQDPQLGLGIALLEEISEMLKDNLKEALLNDLLFEKKPNHQQGSPRLLLATGQRQSRVKRWRSQSTLEGSLGLCKPHTPENEFER